MSILSALVLIAVLVFIHEFGHFISAVASLQRIVTQYEVTITPRKGSEGEQDALVMNAVAKTYRYMDEEETTLGKGTEARQGDWSARYL